MKQLSRLLFLLFLGIQISGCPPDEEIVPIPAEYETTEFFITNLENNDTLLYERYDDWCSNSRLAQATEFSGGGIGDYFYNHYGWGFVRGASGRYGKLVSTYYFGRNGIDAGFGSLNNVLETGVSIFNAPNVYYVISCLINGNYYTSHVRSINYIDGVFFTKTDPTAEVTATPELFGNLGNECRMSNAFLLRTELKYTGFVYRLASPTDSVKVNAEITFNIGVNR
ncbi:MAG: hypothetical protein AB8H12_24955 [Lewinella sp.]